MYHDQYHPRVKQDVKKLHATLREAIQTQHLPDILAHPEQGEPLVEDLKGIWSYHFSFGKQHYRIKIHVLSCFVLDESVMAHYF